MRCYLLSLKADIISHSAIDCSRGDLVATVATRGLHKKPPDDRDLGYTYYYNIIVLLLLYTDY